jgi:hypothetical protein
VQDYDLYGPLGPAARHEVDTRREAADIVRTGVKPGNAPS